MSGSSSLVRAVRSKRHRLGLQSACNNIRSASGAQRAIQAGDRKTREERSAGFIKSLGDIAHGTVVSQVFPSERALAVPMVKEAADLAKTKGIELTPPTLEGFAAAKVLVEGLRRAGRDPTRAGLKKALETFARFDLGGLELSYTPTNHTGLDYADLSIIGQDGKFMR